MCIKDKKKASEDFKYLQKQTKFGKGPEDRFLPGTNISYVSYLKVHQFILRELGKKGAKQIYSLKLNEYMLIKFVMYENGYKIQFSFGVCCLKLRTQDDPILVKINLVNMQDVSHQ